MKSCRGQSTLEYVIILAAIIGAIVLVANTILKPKLQGTYNSLTDKMQNKAGEVNF